MRPILIVLILLTARAVNAQDPYHMYTSMDEALRNPEAVRWLDLSRSGLREVPKEISQLKNLGSLTIYGNAITTLDSIQFPESMQVLSIGHNRIKRISPATPLPKSLSILATGSNGMVEFDPPVLPELRILDLDSNDLGDVRVRSYRLENLRLDHNRLTRIPEALLRLRELAILNLEANRIDSLPPDISKLFSIRTLNLRANRLGKSALLLEGLNEYCSIDLSKNGFASAAGIRGGTFSGKIRLRENLLGKNEEAAIRQLLPAADISFREGEEHVEVDAGVEYDLQHR